jgi:hypothetical protein
MEKFLTLSKSDYDRYRLSSKELLAESGHIADPQTYHYSVLGDFLMRSQLDTHDARLPGTGMFDLKTRAVVSIRMDAANPENGMGYEITERQGEYNSFEREYYDMMRSAFLKYSLQVRMGRMDGIFVAYHNIERIFGFQYIGLPEMDLSIHGTAELTLGDQEFRASLALLNRVLDEATARYPQQSLRIHFETRPLPNSSMYIFVEPVTEEEINSVQEATRLKTEAFERELLGQADDSAKNGAKAASGWFSLSSFFSPLFLNPIPSLLLFAFGPQSFD